VATVNVRWAVLAAAALLAGCGGGSDDDDDRAAAPVGQPAPNIIQPGAPGQPSKRLTPEELAKIPPTPHTPADVAFMQGMIHHHAQALWMTSLVPKRTKDRELRLLARRIDSSQQTEIGQIQDWLRARGEPAPTLHRLHGHAHGIGQKPMPGMLTPKQVAKLRAARGRAFERLFLRDMIQHHQGALTMVAELYEADSGNEPEIGLFARHVDADQAIEISRMQQILARLDAE
jgi:uncharacterized protein (DUF305 family)